MPRDWDLPTFSRSLNPNDYRYLEPEVGCVRNARHDLREVPLDFAHEHRYWEYSLALRAVLRHGAGTVLDVGGGGGLFSPVAAKCGCAVTQVELGDFSGIIAAQSRVIERPIGFLQGDFATLHLDKFDAVVCLSVIEHVGAWEDFFLKLMYQTGPGGLVFVTTDFHPSGEKQVDGHQRTYNEKVLRRMSEEAADRGFTATMPWLRGQTEPDWSHFGHYVYHYSFASLVLRRAR